MRIRPVILLIGFFVITAPPSLAQPHCDWPFLVNMWCEETLVAGEIPGWTEVVGNDWTARTSNPSPEPSDGGKAYFDPGSVPEAELVQDFYYGNLADQSGGLMLLRFLYRTAGESPSDVLRVITEYRNEDGSVLMASFDSGELTSPDAWRWHYGGLHEVFYGTRQVRVRLIATRRSGSSCDAWFDSIELLALCPDPIESTSWGSVKARFR